MPNDKTMPNPFEDIASNAVARSDEQKKAAKANEMGFGEWAARSGEQFGVKDAPVYGMLSRINPVAGPANRARLGAASTYGNDETGWESVKALGPVGVRRELALHFTNDSEVTGKLFSNVGDTEALRRLLYDTSRKYLRTRKGFEQEQEDRNPTGAGGAVSRGARGAVDMIGYMGQIALGPKFFIPTEAVGRFGQLRAPDVALGKDGALTTEGEGSGVAEAAAKALAGAVATYTIEKIAGEAVGKVMRAGSGAAWRAAAPKSMQKLVATMADRTSGTWINGAWRAMQSMDKLTGFSGLPEEIFIEEGMEAAVNSLLDLENEYRSTGMGAGDRFSDSMRKFLAATPEMAISMTLMRGGMFGASVPYAMAKSARGRSQMRQAIANITDDPAGAKAIPDNRLADTLVQVVQERITDDDTREMARNVFRAMRNHGYDLADEDIERLVGRAAAPEARKAAAADENAGNPFDDIGGDAEAPEPAAGQMQPQGDGRSAPAGQVDLLAGQDMGGGGDPAAQPVAGVQDDEGDDAYNAEMERRELARAEADDDYRREMNRWGLDENSPAVPQPERRRGLPMPGEPIPMQKPTAAGQMQPQGEMRADQTGPAVHRNPEEARKAREETERIVAARASMDERLAELDKAVSALDDLAEGEADAFVQANRATMDQIADAIRKDQAGVVRDAVNIMARKARNRARRLRGKSAKKAAQEQAAKDAEAKQQQQTNVVEGTGTREEPAAPAAKEQVPTAEATATPDAEPESYSIGEKVWFRGDEVTITSAPYERDGGTFQDAMTYDGKKVAVVPPGRKAEAAAQKQAEWRKQQEQFAEVARKQREQEARDAEKKPETKPAKAPDGMPTTSDWDKAREIAKKDVLDSYAKRGRKHLRHAVEEAKSRDLAERIIRVELGKEVNRLPADSQGRRILEMIGPETDEQWFSAWASELYDQAKAEIDKQAEKDEAKAATPAAKPAKAMQPVDKKELADALEHLKTSGRRLDADAVSDVVAPGGESDFKTRMAIQTVVSALNAEDITLDDIPDDVTQKWLASYYMPAAQKVARSILEGPLPKKTPDTKIPYTSLPKGNVNVRMADSPYPKVNGLLSAMSAATIKDKDRKDTYAIALVHVDETGTAQATNGKVAVFIPTEGTGSQLAQGDWTVEGKSVVAEPAFPDVRRFIPERKETEVKRVPLAVLLKAGRGMEMAEKHIEFNDRERQGFDLVLLAGKGKKAAFNAAVLASGLRPLWSTGTTHVDVQIKDGKSPVAFFDSDNDKRVAVVMPVKQDKTYREFKLSSASAISDALAEKEVVVSSKQAPSASSFDALPQASRDKFNAAYASGDGQAMAELLYPDNKVLRAEFARRTGTKLPPTLSKTRAAVMRWARELEDTREASMVFARKRIPDALIADPDIERIVGEARESDAKTNIYRRMEKEVGQLQHHGHDGQGQRARDEVYRRLPNIVLTEWVEYVYDTVQERIEQKKRDAYVQGRGLPSIPELDSQQADAGAAKSAPEPLTPETEASASEDTIASPAELAEWATRNQVGKELRGLSGSGRGHAIVTIRGVEVGQTMEDYLEKADGYATWAVLQMALGQWGKAAEAGIDVEKAHQMLAGTQAKPAPKPAPAAPSAPGFLSNLSAEDQARAVELIERMKKRASQLNAGIPDPELMGDGIQLAALYAKSGVKRFADFAKGAFDALGDWSRQYLRAWWAGAQDADGAPEGMEDVTREQAQAVIAELGGEADEAKAEPATATPATAPETPGTPDLDFQQAATVLEVERKSAPANWQGDGARVAQFLNALADAQVPGMDGGLREASTDKQTAWIIDLLSKAREVAANPAAKRRGKMLGQNSAGEELFEGTEDGVRYVVRDGVRIYEKVEMQPTRQGIAKVPVRVASPSRASSEFLTKYEAGKMEAEKKANLPPSARMVDTLTQRLAEGGTITSAELFRIGDEAFGSTRAEGAWTSRQAYDLLETAVNRHIEASGIVDYADPQGTLARLDELLARIPTQTIRDTRQIELQQFSTPPTEAFAAVFALGDVKGRRVMEPSAGNGGLAVMARIAGAQVSVNEIDDLRRANLELLGFSPTNLNGEQLDNLLPPSETFDAVVMNPPFSSTGGRTKAHKTEYGARHVDQALRRVREGGRLVAIVGQGMALDRPTFGPWWGQKMAQVNVRANLGISGEAYKKYGTSFGNQILVMDKSGATPGANHAERVSNIVTGDELVPSEAVDKLAEIRREVSYADVATQQVRADGGKADADSAGAQAGKRGEGTVGSDDGRAGRRTGGRGPASAVQPAVSGNVEQVAGADGQGAGQGNGSDAVGDGTRASEAAEGSGRTEADAELRDGGNDGQPEPSSLELEKVEATRGKIEADGIFAEYKVQSATFAGAKPHPGRLVESAAMAGVSPAKVTKKPNLPAAVVKEGRLSDAQLEAVTYAVQRHEQLLPNGSRLGYWIADGTGVGKGREIAGIIYHNLRENKQKRALWISVADQLSADAERDLGGVGVPMRVLPQSGTKMNESLPGSDGVLFSKYTLLAQGWKRGKERFEQACAWLGDDFEGVIVFDEAHRMKNAFTMDQNNRATGMGGTDTGAMGIALQERFPKARVVYVSATGATVPRNLGYMTRMGLWGPGAPFQDFVGFTSAVTDAGVGGMEMLARDLKAVGAYSSRSISYGKGSGISDPDAAVEYESLVHELTPDEVEQYNTMAELWQTIGNAMTQAEEQTRDGRNVWSQFESAKQRFFLQLAMSYELPTMLADIKKEMAKGRSVVVNLFNTNETSVADQVRQARADNVDLDELEFTPKQMLVDLVNRHFPVQQHEEVFDPETQRTTWQPVVDEAGNPVMNREAQEIQQNLLETIYQARMPDNPLDKLVDSLGAQNVAEVSGRKKRLERRDGEMKYVDRKPKGIKSNQLNEHETSLFQSGKKRVAIITGAAATGITLSSDMTAANQQRRVFYALQLSWSADTQMQAFGRVHRSNQAVPPVIKLCQCNLAGQKRLVNTTSARLASLGALSSGDRKAYGGSVFAVEDITDEYGAAALAATYKAIREDLVPNAETGMNTLERMGVLDNDRNVASGHASNVNKFLNRIMGLPVATQNAVFEHFYSLYRRLVDTAIAEGKYDIGVRTMPHKNVRRLASPEVVYRHPSGAETVLHVFEGDVPVHIYRWDSARDYVKHLGLGFAKRIEDSRVFAVENNYTLRQVSGNDIPAPSYEFETQDKRPPWYGAPAPIYRMIEPAEARALWKEQIDATPKTKKDQVVLLTGAVFPIYDKLTGGEGMTFTGAKIDVDGDSIVGLHLPGMRAAALKQRLGIGAPLAEASPQDVMDLIVANRSVIELDNGMTVRLARASGENRIEVTPKNTYTNIEEEINGYGGFSEVAQWTRRYFLPVGQVEPLAKLLDRHKAIRDQNAPSGNGALYRDVSESLRPSDKARLNAIGRRLFGDDWLRLRDRVLTPQGREAMGRYQDGWAEISLGKGDPESTVLHEAVHRAEDMFLTPDELAALEQAMPDAEARAEGIVRYAADGKGIVGAARRLVARLLRRLRAWLGNAKDRDALLDFYDRLLAGEYARRGRAGMAQAQASRAFRESPDVRARDEAHARAEAAGDTETAQRLVDEAAKSAGYTIEAWHGTRNQTFTEFKRGGSGRSTTAGGDAFYFSSNPRVAKGYAARTKKKGRVLHTYLRSPRHLDLYGEGTWDNYRIDVKLAKANGISLLDYPRNNPNEKGWWWNESYEPGKGTWEILPFPPSIESSVIPWVARKAGYTGVTLHGISDGGRKSDVDMENDTIMVFSPEQIKSADPFTYDDQGRLIPLSERFNPDTPGVRYRSDETVAQAERSWTAAVSDAYSTVAEAIKRKDKNARPDISKLDTVFRTIFYYGEKVPALKRLYEAADMANDDKHRLGEDIFGEREAELGKIRQFAKTAKAEWKKLYDYITKRDMDAVGYRAADQGNGVWAVFDLDGKQVATFADEAQAWAGAHIMEARDLVAAGYSSEAADVLLAYRGIADRMYGQLLGEARDIKKELDALGIEMPKGKDADGNEIDVFEALRDMGDRRGYYMPRIRVGKYLLHATKSGENPRTEAFDSVAWRAKRAVELQRDGYKVDYELSDRPSETAFLDMNLVAMNDVVKNALRDMEKKGQKTPETLDSFGVKASKVQYKRKDGKTETHLVIDAPERSKWTEAFKDFGGRFYDDKQTGTGAVWHFVKPHGSLEKSLSKALFAIDHGGAANMAQEFATVFVKQVAQVIHSRGSRARKMGRSEAVGEDVALGYEPDPLRALAMAGKATAGGTAKRIMARKMMKIITGTDIPWEQFKAEYMDENDIDPDSTDADAKADMWAAYQEVVDERRIDSALQANAYKEGTSYMREMLRNEEGAERLFGVLRGVAALKYLSGIAPGVVNMTAMLTTVPAAMKAFGGIPIPSAARLLSKGATNYAKHMRFFRKGSESSLTGEDAWLFDEISRRGWDEAMMNDEAIGVLQGKARGAFGALVDKALMVFGWTERLNRASTIAAAYYGLREQGVDREEALKKAHEVSNKAHGVYGKKNLPAWTRGPEIGPMAARSFYTYKQFPHNYLQALLQMVGKKDAQATAYMLLSPAVLAGGGATILAPIAALFIKGLFMAIPGAEPPDDPEEALYRWLGDTLGETAERTGRLGLAGLAGVSLKGSLSIGITELPTDLESVLGAPYSMMQDFGYGAKDILNGDLYKGAEKLAPRIVASAMRGYREATEGATTHSNQPIYWGDERLRASVGQAVLRALSFNPAAMAEKSDQRWSERKAESKYSDLRGDIYARVRRYALNGGGSKADWADILVDVERYNARVRRSPFKSVPFVTEKAIRTQLSRMDSVPRGERIRAGSAEREDPGTVSFLPDAGETGGVSGGRGLRGLRSGGRSPLRGL